MSIVHNHEHCTYAAPSLSLCVVFAVVLGMCKLFSMTGSATLKYKASWEQSPLKAIDGKVTFKVMKYRSPYTLRSHNEIHFILPQNAIMDGACKPKLPKLVID